METGLNWEMNFSWRRWKMGVLVSVVTGVCTAFTVGLIVPGMTPKEGAFILVASIAKDLLLFLKEHPVDEITECDCKTIHDASKVPLPKI